jgi:Stress responsive A/B Barrel Domain
MLRHTVFFLQRDTVTPEQRLIMLKGLAYLRFEIQTVRALDFGTDLFGGSSRLREIKPSDRTPRWRARNEGPPSNYDVALHADFDDLPGLEAYDQHPAHREVGAYDAAVSFGEFTARTDYWYDGPPLTTRGKAKHAAMFIWDEAAADLTRQRALNAVRCLEGAPGVERVTIGHSLGTLRTDFDWLMDLQMADHHGIDALLKSEPYSVAMRDVATATRYEWTARVSHLMRGL